MTFFMNGEFDRALAMLHGERAPGCAVMRGRSYVRLQEFDRAGDSYRGGLAYSQDWRERIELELGIANLGRSEMLEISAEKCLSAASRRSDPLLRAECKIALLTSEIVKYGTDASFADVIADVDLAESNGKPSTESWYWYEAPFIKARAFAMLSYAAAARGDMESEQHLLLQAILTSKLCERRDLTMESSYLLNLAFFVRHFDRKTIKHVIELAMEEFNQDLLTSQFSRNYFARALRVNSWQFDDMDRVRESPASSPTILGRLLLCVDETLLGQTEDTARFTRNVNEMCELASRKEWFPEIHQSVDAALICAALAPYDLERARSIRFTRHSTLDELKGMIAHSHRSLNQDFADGIMAKASQAFEEATFLLRAAQHRWRNSGLNSYAAIAGLELYTISGHDADLEDATRIAETFPLTIFGRRIARSLAQARNALEKSQFVHLRYT